MRSGLDPANPAFRWMGEKECRSTICFITANGNLCWVPIEALKSHFLRELPRHDCAAWVKRLILKDVK